MEEQRKELEVRLQDLWWIFKRCWWQMLIVFALVAAVVFSALTFTHEDVYTATASIYVLRNTNETMPNGNNVNLSTSDISIANQIIKDCDVLLRSRDNVLYPVLVAQNMDGVITVERLNSMIQIKNKEDTRVLYLSVTTSSPEKSADIANALADQACEYFNGLYNQKILNPVDGATAPQSPSNPISILMVALVAFVAAFAVYAIYFVVFLMDDKINNAEDVEKYLGLSMLGVIPNRNDINRRKQKYGQYYYGMDPKDDNPSA